MLHIRTALLKLAADDPAIRSVVLPVTRQAKRWEKMPKGWTNESREKFWATLTGDSKHKVSECIKKMTDKGGIDNPGAFCAALADRVMGSDWRKGPRKKKKAFNSPYNNLPDAQGKGWTVEERGDTKRWLWSDPTYHISFAIVEVEDARNFLNGNISYLLRVQDQHGKIHQARKPEMHLHSAFHQAKLTLSAKRSGKDWLKGFSSGSGKLARIDPKKQQALRDGLNRRFDEKDRKTRERHRQWDREDAAKAKKKKDKAKSKFDAYKAKHPNTTKTPKDFEGMKGWFRGAAERRPIERVALRHLQGFNKYNAPEVMGQLMALLEKFDLEGPLDLIKQDKIPQAVDKAWKTREKRASRLAELRASARLAELRAQRSD